MTTLLPESLRGPGRTDLLAKVGLVLGGVVLVAVVAAALDRAVSGVLTAMAEVGLLDGMGEDPERAVEENAAVARQVARSTPSWRALRSSAVSMSSEISSG